MENSKTTTISPNFGNLLKNEKTGPAAQVELYQRPHSHNHQEPPGRFTEREKQVLSFVFEGLANKEIAARIGVSPTAGCLRFPRGDQKVLRGRPHSIHRACQRVEIRSNRGH
jgi:FixJ family two-component response regulator